jgi:hypothetical protein
LVEIYGREGGSACLFGFESLCEIRSFMLSRLDLVEIYGREGGSAPLSLAVGIRSACLMSWLPVLFRASTCLHTCLRSGGVWIDCSRLILGLLLRGGLHSKLVPRS